MEMCTHIHVRNVKNDREVVKEEERSEDGLTKDWRAGIWSSFFLISV